MDTTSLIGIIIVIIAIYFFIKLIVSPLIRTILGIIAFIILVYLLQRLFGFSLDKILAPFGISLGLDKWAVNLDWLLGPINHYMDKAESFLRFLWGNSPKSS